MRSYMKPIAALAVAVVCALGGHAATANAQSPTGPGFLAYGPDTCRQGYVWRAAFHGDTVCVTPAVRAQTAADNGQAASRRAATGGTFGPDTCQPGYVWRVARPSDLVCVTPETRAQVAADNARATERWEAFAVGTHTMALEVDQILTRWSTKHYTSTCHSEGSSPIYDPSVVEVGWGQVEVNGDPCAAVVRQAAVLFNTGALDRIPATVIDRSVLTYDERPSEGCPAAPPVAAPAVPVPDCSRRFSHWTSGSGAPEDKPNGCVVVRIPAVDWANTAPAGLIPYVTGDRPTVTRLGPREWDVTEPYRWQTVPNSMALQSPGSPSLSKGFGFLLSGGPSLDQLTAEDNTFCVSQLTNIRLLVTYTVHPDGPFRPPR